MNAILTVLRWPPLRAALLPMLAGLAMLAWWAAQPAWVWPLWREGVETRAIVKAKIVTDDGFRLDFRFVLADGRVQFASEAVDADSFAAVRLDEEVRAVYWPRDPSVATILPERQGRWPDWPLPVAAAFWMLAGVLGFLGWLRT